MARRRTGLAEIRQGPDNTTPEMLFSDAIDHHARGKRMVGSD
jgi:hypothetical protein